MSRTCKSGPERQEPDLSTPAKSSFYIPGLDGIRALAFLTVFWAHALPPVAFYIPATLGVTVFFFLSGYLIATLLRREFAATGRIALGDFYLRRALRIVVPLYVVYALAAGFAHFVQHESMGNLRGLLSMVFYFYNYAQALHVQAWVPLGLNVIWSLSVEEHFYILFPLLFLALWRSRLRRSTQTRLLLGFCALDLLWRVVLVAVLHDHDLWTYYATDARLDSILWGCVLAFTNNPVYFAAGPSPDTSILPRNREFLTFVLSLLLLLASLVPRDHLYKESLRYTVQAMALYCIFSFVIAHHRHWSVAWLEWKPLRYLGWISYVLYLSHDFILNALARVWPDDFRLTGPLGFVIAIVFATLLRYTLELPLQRLRRRLHPAAPAAAISQKTSHFL